MMDEQGKYVPPPGAIRFKVPLRATVWAVEQPARTRTVTTVRSVRLVQEKKDNTTVWREEIRRAPLQKEKGATPLLVRSPFPRLAFLVGTVQGRVMSVGVAGLQDGKKFYRYSRLVSNGMHNVMFGTQVCFGSAWQAIRAGKLDPVDAFWNSRFDQVWEDESGRRHQSPYKIIIDGKRHHVTLDDFAYMTACYSALVAPLVLRYSQAEIAEMARVPADCIERDVTQSLNVFFDHMSWKDIINRSVPS